MKKICELIFSLFKNKLTHGNMFKQLRDMPPTIRFQIFFLEIYELWHWVTTMILVLKYFQEIHNKSQYDVWTTAVLFPLIFFHLLKLMNFFRVIFWQSIDSIDMMPHIGALPIGDRCNGEKTCWVYRTKKFSPLKLLCFEKKI